MSQAAPAPPRPGFDFRALRDREWPTVGRAPYLNAASVTPLPERARAATERYNRRRADAHVLAGEDFDPLLARCREAAAGLVGADADEIALLPNTSAGINLAAQTLPLRPGQRIVVSHREFPANVYPWLGIRQRAGVRVDLVPTLPGGNPDEARLLDEIARGDVGIFALSAVQFSTGWLADLERFGRACREHGTWFVVDGIQAVGQLPVDVRAWHVDVLATGGHKWLCGPFGVGFTYVRHDLVPRMEPRVVGWTSMAATADYARCVDYRYEWVEGARRFEVATQPLQDYAALLESIALLREADPARIRTHVLGLLDPLAEWLREREIEIVSDLAPERRSGVFAFRPDDADAAFRALWRAGVNCVPREGAVRLSPHLYNTSEDIARVMEVLEAWRR
ncbi:MAG TPA: aminotransferase class V-fold PLP-dependent enzyme [Longimicrobium sp.]|nr:aminotransferase class V-fold PLP-dependent enzyme [Longimicrobium sp.]